MLGLQGKDGESSAAGRLLSARPTLMLLPAEGHLRPMLQVRGLVLRGGAGQGLALRPVLACLPASPTPRSLRNA